MYPAQSHEYLFIGAAHYSCGCVMFGHVPLPDALLVYNGTHIF